MKCSCEYFRRGVGLVPCDKNVTYRRQNDGAFACDHHQVLMSEVHRLFGRSAADDVWDKIQKE